MLTDTLGNGLGLNILSTILRRGGAKQGGSAVLVAVCEPTEEDTESSATAASLQQLDQSGYADVLHQLKNVRLRKRIDDKLASVPPRFCAQWWISRGRKWEKTLYLTHPDDIGVRVPEELRLAVEQVKRDEVIPGYVPVFLSRRFAGANAQTDRLVAKIRSTLHEKKYQSIEATPVAGTLRPTVHQVESRLWACKLGIVLVTTLKEADALSMNLAHEYGFISGQGKPVIFLIQKSVRSKLTELISNLQGMVVEEFADGDEALNDWSHDSVSHRISNWLKRIDHPPSS